MAININAAEGRDPLALKLPDKSFVVSQTKKTKELYY